MSFEEAVGKNTFHLSLLVLIPLCLVLFAIGPLWVAVTILSKALLPVWRSGLPLHPDLVQGVIQSIRMDFWISVVVSLTAGWIIAYALIHPLSQIRRAFREIVSGKSPEQIKLDTSGEFKDLSDEFNQMVSTLELQERIRQTERLAGLGALAAGVAHEIRNPLGSIRGLAQLLKEGDVDWEKRKYSDEIIKQVDRLNETLGTFLHLSRPSNRILTRENINHLLHQGVELLRFEGSEKDIRLIENYDHRIPELELDSEAMLQAFLNIFLNAVQAIPESGQITVETSLTGDGQVNILISNTQSTIPPGDLKRVFDPFFTTKQDGTGLGLAITHQVVTSHDGKIDVYAQGDQTVFKIELPIKKIDVGA